MSLLNSVPKFSSFPDSALLQIPWLAQQGHSYQERISRASFAIDKVQRYLRPFTNSLQQRVPTTFEILNFFVRWVLYQRGIFFFSFFSYKWRKREREQVLGTPTPTPFNLRMEKKMIHRDVLDLHGNEMLCSGADISTPREGAGGDRQALHFLRLSFLVSWRCDSVSSKPSVRYIKTRHSGVF